MSHTKGPYVAQGHIVRQYVGENVGGRIIADCGPHHTRLSEYPKSCLAEDEANAKRIALALNAFDSGDETKRELFEALEDVVIDTGTSGYWWGDKARAAIAKAKEAKP